MSVFTSRAIASLLMLTAVSTLDSHEGLTIATLCSDVNGCQNISNISSITSHLRNVNTSDVNITFLQSFHLDEALHFNDPSMESMTIKFAGISSEVAITCLQDEEVSMSRGFYFEGIESISLVDLTFQNCSLMKKIDLHAENQYRSALYFVDCSDITIHNVNVSHSLGSGITILNYRGTVEVTDSNFIGNKLSEEFIGFGGGSGVFLVLNNTHNSSALVCNCHFSRNRASSQNIGRGGGIRVLITNTSSENMILIDSSSFTGNEGGWGGGLYLFYEGNPEGNTINITDTTIEGNHCYERSGGGADLGFILDYDDNNDKFNDNLIHFERCNFIDNTATLYGGGTSIFASRLARSDPKIHFIAFKDCIWRGNRALAGSAVDIAPSISEIHVHGVFPRPLFVNCSFISNEIRTKYLSNADASTKNVNVSFSGEGTVLVTGYWVLFEGTTVFSDNIGCGLYISSGTVELCPNSVTTFTANRGNNGGALVLGTFAIILIHDDSSLSFINNTANLLGGAIYARSNDPHDLNSTSCFVHRFSVSEGKESGIVFHFEGNRALSKNGNDVFLSSVRQCRCAEHSGNELETFLCLGNVTVPGDFDVATRVSYFVANGSSEQSVLSNIIPGSRFYEVPVIAYDEYNDSRSVIYEVIPDEVGGKIIPNSSYVSQNKLQFVGELNASSILHLETDMMVLSFNITSASNCPPGFFLTDGECRCEAENYFGLSHCSDDQAYIIQGFWMGKCLDGTGICTSHCPLGFCVYYKGENSSDVTRGIHELPSYSSELEQFICGPTRKGVLCGSCSDNYSAYYHSYQYACGDKSRCKYGIPLYIVSELLPLTAMFFVIIIFDIKFTAGSVNGFIFFAQVLDSIAIDANGAIMFPKALDHLTSIHRFIYRNLNFDFFSIEELSFCLWEDATTLDAMVMKYATILYAIGLLVLLIVFMNTWKCKRLFSCWRPRTIQSSAKNGLTAFIVICYSQCARVSFQILSPGYLYGLNYTNEGKVAFRRGDYGLFSSEHLRYAVPAILVLFVMSLIPFFLILYPLFFKVLALCKLNESKFASILSRLIPIPLLDSFQSSFKDNFRFFAGLYFLYRLLALAAYAYSKTLVVFYTWVELKLIVILALHSTIQPYKVKWHNIIDSLIFANLAIINGITLFNYFKVVNASSKGGRKEGTVAMFSAIQVVLIYVPLLCIIVYFSIWGYRRCKARLVKNNSSDASVSSIVLPPLRDEDGTDDNNTNRTQALLSDFTYGM